MSLIPYAQVAEILKAALAPVIPPTCEAPAHAHDHDHPDEVAMPGVVDAITEAPGCRIVSVGASRIEIPDALEIGDIIRVGDLVDVIIRRA